MRLGIIGWGAIGAGVGRRVLAGALVDVALAAVLRRSGAPIEGGPPVFADLDAFLASGLDVVLEAAGAAAVAEAAPGVLEAGLPFVVMSSSGLIDDALRARLVAQARRTGGRILVPAGALGGVDVATAAIHGGLDRVEITQSKPPAALLPPAEAAACAAPRVLEETSPREAGRRFPKNANIAVGLGLAAGALDTARVRIVADPGVRRNTAEVLLEGGFGRMTLRLENEPSESPRTSQLAIFSALGALERLSSPFVLGA